MNSSWLIIMTLLGPIVGHSSVHASAPQDPPSENDTAAPTTLQEWWKKLDPNRFSLRQWQRKDGLPQNSVTCITQTRDGYLWFGTFGGLARFNGVNFEIFDPNNTPQLRSTRILSLFEDSTGALWVGTTLSFTRFKDGRFTDAQDIADPESRPPDDLQTLQRYTAFAETPDRAIWIAGSNGLVRFKEGRFDRYTKADGLPALFVRALATTEDGALWIGTNKGLAVYRDERIEVFPNLPVVSERTISAMHVDEENSLWLGGKGWVVRLINEQVVFSRGAQHGLEGAIQQFGRLDENRLILAGQQLWYIDRRTLDIAEAEQVPKLPFPIPTGYRSTYLDREDNLWLGTDTFGVVQFRRTNYLNFGESQGLTEGTPQVIASDGSDGLVVRDGSGRVARIPGTRSKTENFTVPPSFGKSWNAHSAPDGSLFIFNQKAISIWKEGRWTSLECNVEQDGRVKSVHLDDHDRLWILTADGLWLRREGHEDTFHAFPESLNPVGNARIHTHDADGHLWLSTNDQILHFRDGVFESFTHVDGLAYGQIRSIHVDEDGHVWITTYGGGLCRIKDGSLFTFSTQNGLLDNSLSRLLEDNTGHFWINSNRGVLRVSRHDLNAFADGLQDDYNCHRLITGEANGGMGFKSADGKLWFPVFQGVVGIDPNAYEPNEIPPLIQVNTLEVDGISYEVGSSLDITPGRRDLTIRYDGLSFVDPELVQFKYQLIGYDEDWRRAGTIREVHYTNLPPGPYEFRVMAQNSHGVWSDPVPGMTLVFEPYFHETRLFQASVVFGLLIVVGIGWRLRLRGLHRHYEAVRFESIERKKTQVALQASEERFALSMAGSHDGYWDWDLVTDSVWFSDRFKKLLDYSIDMAFSNTLDWFNELLHPDDHEATWKAVNDHLEHRKPYDLEYRLRTESGAYRWFRGRGQAIWNHEGKAVRMAGSIQNITERKKAEEALQKTHSYLKLLKTAAIAANEATDVESAIQTVLDEVCACTGWTMGAAHVRVAGVSDRAEYKQFWHLDDPVRFEPFRTALQKIPVEKGMGLSGSVFTTGKPVWVPDIQLVVDELPLGDLAVSLGLRSALFLPVLIGSEVVGILVFSSLHVEEPDRQFLEAMADVGTQLGRVIERKEAEATLINVARGYSTSTDELFFKSMASHLALELDADYTIIGELCPDDSQRISTIAALADGELIENFQYDLRGTPCENVTQQNQCVYKCGIQDKFPEDQLLIDMGVEAYVGTPLNDTNGNAIGLMAVLFRHELEDTRKAETLLRIYAVRAQAELERKRTEVEIQEKEKQLDNLLSNVGVIVLEGDPFDIFYVGGQVERILGYPKELWFEDPDGPVGFWSKHLHPDDLDKLEICRRAIELGEDHAFEYRMIAADGREIWFYDTVTVETENGVPVRTRSVMVDITDRKRAEEALRRSEALLMTSIENSPAGIIIVDAPDRKVRIANSAALRIIGPTDTPFPEIPVDQYSTIWTSLRSDGTEYLDEDLPLSQAIHKGVITESKEMILRRDGEEDRWVLINAAPVRNSEGEIIAGIAVFPDITERKRSEIRQKIMMAELDHRVKNNLSAVIALAEQTIAAAPSLAAFRESYVGRIRALARIHEALAATKWTGAKLSEILRLTLDPYSRENSHRISTRGDDVILDARSCQPITMALHELATNAAKYGSLSTPEGTVSIEWQLDPKQQLHFSWVESGGPPIADSPQPGFGSSLIQGVIEHELRGTVGIEYRKEGLSCTMVIPMEPQPPHMDLLEPKITRPVKEQILP